MTASPNGARITGPLRTWYDLHEALAHEVRALAELAVELTPDNLGSYCDRFGLFVSEFRTHSEVEDAIMFPAVRNRGGPVDSALLDQHRQEQLSTYELSCALMRARAGRDAESLHGVGPSAAATRDSLLAHLELEEAEVLSQISELFSDDEQAHLLQTIFSSVPSDPHLQAWVAGALTPEHLESRLRNLAATLEPQELVTMLRRIRADVDADTWQVIEARTPDLAALVAS